MEGRRDQEGAAEAKDNMRKTERNRLQKEFACKPKSEEKRQT